MSFTISISHIQHLENLDFSIDLSKNGLMCIVGKNGSGKTTLIRAIRNLAQSDTFLRTASKRIFNEKSSITYNYDGKKYVFSYDKNHGAIDSREVVESETKNNIYAELPIPYGSRFEFKSLSDSDDDLRKCITLKQYGKPSDLIKLLNSVYNTNRFDNLKSFKYKRKNHYFILLDNEFYIREDYLSTGEYFVIQLFELIQRKCRLIVIDELDISLDASAQVNLLKELRQYCAKYLVNIVFTTHSLALMKCLESEELYYLENYNAQAELKNVSYNYIKSVLFGFVGYDKYLLTEDRLLNQFMQFLLANESQLKFLRYTIIHVGGAGQTVDLMDRNRLLGFFSENPQRIMTVLDGDQAGVKSFLGRTDLIFLPFKNIEHQLELHYLTPGSGIPDVGNTNGKKDVYRRLISTKKMNDTDIFKYLFAAHADQVNKFKKELIAFLSR